MKLKSTYLSVILALVFVFSSTEAQDYSVLTKVKYVKSFTKYVEWPEGYKTGDFIIGVLNNPSFAASLESMVKDKKLGTQDYKVINYTSTVNIAKCHILYIPTDKSNEVKTALAKVKKYSTLVITDKPGLVTQSGINLVMDGPKQQFEINQTILSQSKLSVSAQLVSMASKVVK